MKDSNFSEKFKKSKFDFPDQRDKKDKQFFLKYFQAIYSDYVKDKGAIPFSRRFDFNLLRLYAEGNQPVDKYMDILCPFPEGKRGGAREDREGWMNISWDILSVVPKFRRIFTGMFEKIEHDVICTAINDKALGEKEEFKWKLWAEKELAPYFEQLSEEMGVENETPEWMPSTMQELELFMQESFKLQTEIAMESGLNYSFYLSNWNEIKKRMFEDWFDWGVAACRDYVDPIDGKVKAEHIDARELIIRYTNEKDFSDIDYWGRMKQMTIAELRQKSGLDEDTLCQIAQLYSESYDNKVDFMWPDYYSLQMTNTQLPYDNFKVQVMFGEFITSDTKKVKTVKLKNGARKTYTDKKVPKQEWEDAGRENREVDNVPYQISMCGWWIVGSDHVFECGKSYVQPRPEKKNPLLSINIYRYSNKSILASIIPNVDSFQLTWLKLQNALAVAAPAGLQIEIGALEEISIGGVEWTPQQIIALRRGSGDLLYKATTHFSESNPAGAAHPIQELSGGIGNQLQEFITLMEHDIKIIRDLTGINEAIDASSPQERVAVGTSQMAVTAANNALQPIYSGYTALKERTAKKMISRYQTLAHEGKMKGYYPSLGSTQVKIFEIGSEITAEEYGIKLQVRPTDEMKQAVRQAALASEQLGKKQGGITHSDYLYIEEKLQDNQLKYARLYLDYKERMYEKEIMASSQANTQAQQQGASQLEQMKIQAKQAEIGAKAQADIAIGNAASENRLKELQFAHDLEMQKIQLTNQGKHENEIIKGTIKKDIELNKPEKTQNNS